MPQNPKVPGFIPTPARFGPIESRTGVRSCVVAARCMLKVPGLAVVCTTLAKVLIRSGDTGFPLGLTSLLLSKHTMQLPYLPKYNSRFLKRKISVGAPYTMVRHMHFFSISMDLDCASLSWGLRFSFDSFVIILKLVPACTYITITICMFRLIDVVLSSLPYKNIVSVTFLEVQLFFVNKRPFIVGCVYGPGKMRRKLPGNRVVRATCGVT